MAADWSEAEVEAITADYFVMLIKELRREPYNKTAHRRALSMMLQNRSDGSIERKHQNISSILIGVGYPYISGYKPLGNYQHLLADVLIHRVLADQNLATTVNAAVTEPASVPNVRSILALLEAPPQGTPFSYPPVGASSSVNAQPIRPPVNYLEREARNSSLGRAGEEFIVAFERARLTHLGKEQLAERVEHIALTQGDGYGFDVRSFEHNGEDRLIEVKTTAYGKQTPFFVSKNEIAVSRFRDETYHLYRLFEFRDNPRLYSLRGPLDRVCHLDPIEFAARPL